MAAPLEEDDADLFKDDYYAILNLPKDASKDDVNNAYRKFSKIFHPDKHQDPLKKKDAEQMFGKLKRAHEVLSDEHKRVIYDLYGEKGLETYGMEVISRTKTPAEIIAEYERFQKEQEDRRLQQQTNPRGQVTIGLNATDLFDHYASYEEYEEPHFPTVEINTMNISQTVECPLTVKDTVVVGGTLSTQNGRGSGVFLATWRRLLSNKSWAELETTIGTSTSMNLKVSRQLTKRIVGTASCVLVVQLDQNLQGRITWNVLLPSFLATSVIYDTQKHHALFSIQLGILSSFVIGSYTRKFQEIEGKARVAIKAGTFGIIFEYGVEKRITKFSTLGATVILGIPTGVMLKIKLNRGQQTFNFPIMLSEQILPSAIFYGTFMPIFAYFVVKKIIINPFLQEQNKKEIEKKRQEHADKVAQRKREAEAAVELMKETVERSIEVEEKKTGLVIVKALYGKLVGMEGEMARQECIDVTIPIQALVKDSKLIVPDTASKSNLPGFYDPTLGDEKQLYIKYKFHNRLHVVTLRDEEPIRLPQQKHRVRDEPEPSNNSSSEGPRS
ncbi:hypothetical protein CHS0354_019884 [Potamilus streckersoni]|uniref:J domain-containing protein n=1 Tax=Potamilus streckersoni TaxID=2493646 RepID=A0AAE0VYM4_9BIVA|nr:hypothetical protein CHS0354_019884 [Potamilus streckersoni]